MEPRGVLKQMTLTVRTYVLRTPYNSSCCTVVTLRTGRWPPYLKARGARRKGKEKEKELGGGGGGFLNRG